MMTGQRIRDLRKEKRLSQTELADVVHVSQQTITAWENDKAEPSSSAIAALADYFGGTHVYIPKMEKLLKKVKYKAIIEEFDGGNIRKLAKKYDVSESTVYRILKEKLVKCSVKQIEGQMDFSDFGI